MHVCACYTLSVEVEKKLPVFHEHAGLLGSSSNAQHVYNLTTDSWVTIIYVPGPPFTVTSEWRHIQVVSE
jgi:hypothetical protein